MMPLFFFSYSIGIGNCSPTPGVLNLNSKFKAFIGVRGNTSRKALTNYDFRET
jgi:hypothetical protein